MEKLNIQNYIHFSFDLWLTLIKSHKEFKPKRNILFKSFFDIKSTQEQVNQAIRYYDVLCTKMSVTTGKHISRIDSVTLEEFSQETEQLFLKYKPELIYPNISNLFKKIKNENKTISILSNTAFILGKTLHKVLSEYELNSYFSFEIYSDELGLAKPNSEIFQILYEKVNQIKTVDKQKIIHIGDNHRAD